MGLLFAIFLASSSMLHCPARTRPSVPLLHQFWLCQPIPGRNRLRRGDRSLVVQFVAGQRQSPVQPSLIGQVAYTWSRCIDDGSVSSGLEQGQYEVTDTYNQSYDRGPCSFNVTQSFRINGIYSLPFKGNRAIAGWEVSPIFSASTGLSINVMDGLGAGGQAGLGGIEGPRPNIVPGCKPYLRTWENWYNPGCYYLPPYGTLGNVGRDNLIGPGLWISISLSSRTPS